MKSRIVSTIAISLTVIAFLSGCSKPAAPKITQAQKTQISTAATDFINHEADLLYAKKPKFASELASFNSAFTANEPIFEDVNGEPAYLNVSWLPKTKPSAIDCKFGNVEGDSSSWQIYCSIEYADTGTCGLWTDFPKDKGITGLPQKLEDFYDADAKPKYSIICTNYEDEYRPSKKNLLFIEQPVKIKTNPLDVTTALLQYGGCTYPSFSVKKLIKQGSWGYHIVTDHVSDDYSAQGQAYDALTVTIEPRFDNYQLEQDGYGWEAFFGCPMFDDSHGKVISATGAQLSGYLQ